LEFNGNGDLTDSVQGATKFLQKKSQKKFGRDEVIQRSDDACRKKSAALLKIARGSVG
jgi:hypothetical protein